MLQCLSGIGKAYINYLKSTEDGDDPADAAVISSLMDHMENVSVPAQDGEERKKGAANTTESSSTDGTPDTDNEIHNRSASEDSGANVSLNVVENTTELQDTPKSTPEK